LKNIGIENINYKKVNKLISLAVSSITSPLRIKSSTKNPNLY